VRQSTKEEGPDAQNTGRLSPKGFMQTRHLTFDERKKLQADRKLKQEQDNAKASGTSEQGRDRQTTQHEAKTNEVTAAGSTIPGLEHDEELEAAIRASVLATSTGNVEQDAVVERAMRASIAELQKSGSLTEAEAMEHAINTSMTESQRLSSAPDSGYISPTEDAKYNALLEKSIQLSLQESRNPRITVDVDSEDDEDIKRAIEESKKHSHIENSSSQALSNEERVVLEYVKKQSLAEEEHKFAMRGRPQESDISSSSEGATGDGEDHDLERAIEESKRFAR